MIRCVGYLPTRIIPHSIRPIELIDPRGRLSFPPTPQVSSPNLVTSFRTSQNVPTERHVDLFSFVAFHCVLDPLLFEISITVFEEVFVLTMHDQVLSTTRVIRFEILRLF